MPEKICLNCFKTFSIHPYELKRAKYCSRNCKNEYSKGKHLSPDTEFKVGNPGLWKGKKRPEIKEWLSPFNKGDIPWNKGKHTGIKPWLGKKRLDMLGELNKAWKGDAVGYTALHDWVRSKLGKPTHCSQCNITKSIQWANKSHKYKRDITDWIMLCASCHKNYDKEYRLKTQNH